MADNKGSDYFCVEGLFIVTLFVIGAAVLAVHIFA